MFQTLKNAWKIKDIRKKILFTIFIIIIYRIGTHIPVPFVDTAALFASFQQTANVDPNNFMSFLNIYSGGALAFGSILALSVTPYINATIIMQLLTIAIPPLERLSKEGEEGRKTITKITRIATVFLGLIEGTAFFFYLNGSGFVTATGGYLVFAGITIVLCLAAGSAAMMWMGEEIDKKGIGNGISMLLFAGILSRMPQAVSLLAREWAELNHYGKVISVVLVFVAVIVFIVFVTSAEHRIPIQYAKRVVGRKMVGGQNSFLPIKVNMSGVMPIIFASSILLVPTTILGFMQSGSNVPDTRLVEVLSFFSYKSASYAIMLIILIIAFAYFYQTIQYNPVEMANNLRKNNGSIPGIRPGKPTSDYITKVLRKVTLLGALFLGFIAVLPLIVGAATGLQIALGGTTILILVGVAIDFVSQLESQTMMRHYKGFLD